MTPRVLVTGELEVVPGTAGAAMSPVEISSIRVHQAPPRGKASYDQRRWDLSRRGDLRFRLGWPSRDHDGQQQPDKPPA
jgi:hypothetical protein